MQGEWRVFPQTLANFVVHRLSAAVDGDPSLAGKFSGRSPAALVRDVRRACFSFSGSRETFLMCRYDAVRETDDAWFTYPASLLAMLAPLSEQEGRLDFLADTPPEIHDAVSAALTGRFPAVSAEDAELGESLFPWPSFSEPNKVVVGNLAFEATRTFFHLACGMGHVASLRLKGAWRARDVGAMGAASQCLGVSLSCISVIRSLHGRGVRGALAGVDLAAFEALVRARRAACMFMHDATRGVVSGADTFCDLTRREGEVIFERDAARVTEKFAISALKTSEMATKAAARSLFHLRLARLAETVITHLDAAADIVAVRSFNRMYTTFGALKGYSLALHHMYVNNMLRADGDIDAADGVNFGSSVREGQIKLAMQGVGADSSHLNSYPSHGLFHMGDRLRRATARSIEDSTRDGGLAAFSILGGSAIDLDFPDVSNATFAQIRGNLASSRLYLSKCIAKSDDEGVAPGAETLSATSVAVSDKDLDMCGDVVHAVAESLPRCIDMYSVLVDISRSRVGIPDELDDVPVVEIATLPFMVSVSALIGKARPAPAPVQNEKPPLKVPDGEDVIPKPHACAVVEFAEAEIKRGIAALEAAEASSNMPAGGSTSQVITMCLQTLAKAKDFLGVHNLIPESLVYEFEECIEFINQGLTYYTACAAAAAAAQEQGSAPMVDTTPDVKTAVETK